MKKLFTALVVLMISVAAYATSFSTAHTYFVRYHFSGVAFDKPVKAVWIHTGVSERAASWRGGQETWTDVIHMEMQKVGGHFFAKVRHDATSSYEHHYSRGVNVQYWVYFQDGTELKTAPARVEIFTLPPAQNERNYLDRLRDLSDEYLRVQDSMDTRGHELSYTTIS